MLEFAKRKVEEDQVSRINVQDAIQHSVRVMRKTALDYLNAVNISSHPDKKHTEAVGIFRNRRFSMTDSVWIKPSSKVEPKFSFRLGKSLHQQKNPEVLIECNYISDFYASEAYIITADGEIHMYYPLENVSREHKIESRDLRTRVNLLDDAVNAIITRRAR